MIEFRGYELYHCKPRAGLIVHGNRKVISMGESDEPCFYWQVRLNGKLIDTALTLKSAKFHAKFHASIHFVVSKIETDLQKAVNL